MVNGKWSVGNEDHVKRETSNVNEERETSNVRRQT